MPTVSSEIEKIDKEIDLLVAQLQNLHTEEAQIATQRKTNQTRIRHLISERTRLPKKTDNGIGSDSG